MIYPVYERTITTAITATGIGLHSGKEVVLTLQPALAGAGICFVRTDLNNARIPLDARAIHDTLMSSNLVQGDIKVGTIEHLLSAIAALGVDNLLIEISAPEIPIMDGSAAPFLYLLMEAGITEQEKLKEFIKIKREVRVADADKWATLTPCNLGFTVNFEIDFAHKAIQETAQTFSFNLSSSRFASEVAKARTFGFLKDLAYLQQNNLALGGSLDNAIVLDEERVVNREGLHFPDEFVRHKVLDAVGDLYAIGKPILGQFDAYKSGHALNNKLLRAILADPDCYEIVTFYDKDTCPIRYYSPNSGVKSAKIAPEAVACS